MDGDAKPGAADPGPAPRETRAALAGPRKAADAPEDFHIGAAGASGVHQDAFRYSVCLAMARASQLAYRDGDEIAAVLVEAGAVVDLFQGPDDVSGFVAAWPTHVIVAFRGTATRANWRINLKVAGAAIPNYSGRVTVHEGFYEAYLTVRSAIHAAVMRALVAERRKVYFTGHSLGGALATIATADFSNLAEGDARDWVSACYTFASPRVANRDFDLYVRTPLYRVTRGVDLVPAIPFRVWLPGWGRFYQGGDTRYFRSNPRHLLARRQPPSYVWNVARGVWSLVPAVVTGRFDLIADHAMSGYVERVRAAKREIDRARRAKAFSD